MATAQMILVSRRYPMSHVSRNSSVIILNGYGLNDWGQIPGKARDNSLPFPVQTKPGAHAGSYPKDRVGCFSGSAATGVPRMRIREVIGLHQHLWTSS
jgi:hypothetical protein